MRQHVVHVVVTDQFAGVERQVASVANGLAERGWTVTVIGGEAASMRAALDPGIEQHAVAGIFPAIRRLAGCRGVDVLHAHLTAAEVASVTVAPLLRAPILATRHIAARRGSSLIGGMGAPLVRRALAGQLAPSRFLADLVGEDVRIVPSGVPDRVRSSLQRERSVLVLQRLEPEKATEVAVAAFAASGLAECGWRLIVAGRGAAESSLRHQSRAAGIGREVDFIGFVSNPAELLDRASILVAPTPAEAFGLSVVEAMAAGLPVIAAASGAHPEVLGPNSWMFAPGDVERAGELIRLMAASPGQRSMYGEHLRARQREMFTIKAHLDALEQIYREVLTRPYKRRYSPAS